MEPAALDGYVRLGFRDRPDGQVELARARPRSRRGSSSAAPGPTARPRRSTTWRRCTRTSRSSCADGTDLPDGMFAAQAERAGVDLVTVSGTHFFVQEDSARAAALVREHLAW